MKNIEFWFSIGSTYTYLSVQRIFEIEKKHNVRFIWQPFSVRQIMIEMETKEKMADGPSLDYQTWSSYITLSESSI